MIFETRLSTLYISHAKRAPNIIFRHQAGASFISDISSFSV